MDIHPLSQEPPAKLLEGRRGGACASCGCKQHVTVAVSEGSLVATSMVSAQIPHPLHCLKWMQFRSEDAATPCTLTWLCSDHDPSFIVKRRSSICSLPFVHSYPILLTWEEVRWQVTAWRGSTGLDTHAVISCCRPCPNFSEHQNVLKLLERPTDMQSNLDTLQQLTVFGKSMFSCDFSSKLAQLFTILAYCVISLCIRP